jgi:hypothetical protein
MESRQFDRFTRTWASDASRRSILGLLAGSAFGLAGLAASEAGKKGKKKVTLCLNGQTITVKKSKKGSLLGQGATQGACAVSPPPPPRPSPPPPVNRCANGVKDGSESDIDCGGSCGRCEVLKACTSRDDCITARCSGGVCTACQAGGGCGDDDFGACVCEAGACASNATLFLDGGQCGDCPDRTIACVPFAPGIFCYAPCGEGFEQ